MEKIKINAIEPKFGKPNDKGVCTPFWAIQFDNRKGTVWDAQIADYMMKDVGVGGSLMVDIKVTPQGYNNIRAIDFKSAEKGETYEMRVPSQKLEVTKQEKFRTPHEMVATELTCGLLRYNTDGVTISDAVDMYKEALRLLDE